MDRPLSVSANKNHTHESQSDYYEVNMFPIERILMQYDNILTTGKINSLNKQTTQNTHNLPHNSVLHKHPHKSQYQM